MSDVERPASPYVGLVPFSEAQAPFFFGRETERDLIIENLRASRLTLLYGTSGVGKSSVLHAGAAYLLRQIAQQSLTQYGAPEFVVVTFSAWRDDPVTGLMRNTQEAIAKALKMKSRDATPESRNLAQMMGAWSERYGIELLVILDQFEEYFQYRPNETGAGTFGEEFPRAVNDLKLRAKFLISLRDDALSKLDFFKPQIPGLFNNLLRIEHMNGVAAKDAIVKPLTAYNNLYLKDKPEEQFSIEPLLVDEVIKQVATDEDAQPSDKSDDLPRDKQAMRIETPYLQLVMTRLWEKEEEEWKKEAQKGEVEKHPRVLRLKTLEDLKGIKNIVQVHLNNALETLSAEQQMIAARIFDYLVTPSGTKIAYFESDLLKKTNFPPEKLSGVLKILSQGRSRILRPIDPPPDRPGESRYEVFHDVLAQAILNWQTKFTQAAELAEAERKRREAALARQARILRVLVAALIIVSLIALWFALDARSKSSQANKASRDLADALRVEQEARETLAEKSKELETALREVDALFEQIKDKLTPEEIAAYQAYRKLNDDKSNTIIKTQGGNSAPVPTLTKRWPKDRQTLHIRFMDGDPALHKRVEQIAQEWTNHANIKFLFDSAPDAEIRISFAQPGSWSYIGIDALNTPRTEPTMNFGFLKDISNNEAEFRRTVLHEFGHLLGLIHEHQNPKANIPWNKTVIYQRFTTPPYAWDKATIDNNIFNKYSGDYRNFDPQSIMMFFPIPKEFLIGDDFQPILKLSTELSQSDKDFIAQLYPKNESTQQ